MAHFCSIILEFVKKEEQEMNIKELKENLITDFEDYLKEYNLEISTNWIVNETYINNYLMSNNRRN